MFKEYDMPLDLGFVQNDGSYWSLGHSLVPDPRLGRRRVASI